MNNIKPIIVQAQIDENLADDTGVEFISLVHRPATQSSWIAMQEYKEEIKLAVQSEDKMILVGKVLIPDMPILRGQSKDGNPVFINFTADSILKVEQKFARSNYNNNINEQHTSKMVDAFIFESWIVEDPSKDKSALYFTDVNPGTWMVSVQITNKEYWNEFIKSGKLTGFSIEGIINYYYPQVVEEEELQKLETLSEILEKINLGLK